jgi:PAS domain S-box-containing protein
MFVKTLRLDDPAAPTRLAAALAMALGLLTLSGRALGLHALASLLPGAVEMKVNTGIGVFCAGLSLLMLSERPSRLFERCAQALALLVAIIGIATLGEYLSGWNLGIDELLAKDTSQAYNVFRGRMSPLSAVSFAALGISLALLRHRALRAAATAGAVLAAITASVSLLGYLWNAGELITDRWVPPVALNTACCLMLLSVGILLSPRRSERSLTADLAALPSVEAKTLIGFAIGFCLLLIGGGYTYRTNAEFASSSAWVAHSQEVRASLQAVYGSLAGAELAERDYLITADPHRLQDYEALKSDVEAGLGRVGRLTQDNPVQQANVARLSSLVAGRLDDINEGLRVFASSGLAAARVALARSRELNPIEKVHAQTDAMDGLERGYLAEREAAATRSRVTTLISLIVTLAAAAAVFIALFAGIHREMRARRRSDAELVEANRFLDSLIENLPIAVVIKDLRTLTFVRQNRAFEQLFGFEREELSGKSAHELFTAEEADFIVAKDREALAAGALVEIPEHTIHTRHHGSRTFHTMKMPILGRDQKPQYLMAISIDVTQRKLSEQAVHELNAALEAKAAQLQATNRELESFSYSVSHDLRAPLRGIDGFAMMLEEDYAARLDSEGRRYLSVIREASRRMGALIDDLLAFSRLGKQSMASHEIDMAAMVRDVVQELLHSHRGQAPEIVIGELPPVQADSALLRQVWTNLIANAVKYSSKSERPRIEIAAAPGDGEIVYSVRDNGVGFDMEYVGKLFGVFQRLHRADEFTGTGVGLAIVHRIITRHGGRVWAEGRLNEGAAFFFALPVEGPPPDDALHNFGGAH